MDEVPAEARELSEILESAGASPPAGEPGRRFRELAHNLAGSAACFVFPGLGDRARALEEAYLRGAGPDVLAAAIAPLVESVREAVASGLASPRERRSAGTGA